MEALEGGLLTYEQMEDESDGDSDDENFVTSNKEDGTYIPLPDSIKQFTWYSFISPGKHQGYDRKKAEKIARDILPHNGCVLRKHILARMNATNQPMKNHLYDSTRDELEFMRDKITKIINQWMYAFIIFCANECGMTIKGKPIKTWDDYLFWVTHCIASKEDAMMIIKTLILSFQHLADFRQNLTYAILIEYNYRFPSRDKTVRKTKSFCEKLISHRHNAIRRQINNRSKKSNGYTYKVIRSEGKNITRERNYPCYFFTWMLIYNETICEQKKKGRPFGSSSAAPKSRPTGPYSKKPKQMSKSQIMNELEQIEHIKTEMLQRLQLMNDKDGTFISVFIVMI
jgi:hypothetical protein